MASHPKRPEIEARLKAGEFESFNQLAREFGVSPKTVTNYARALGVDPLEVTRVKTKKATEVRMTYDAARRMELIDRALDKGRQMLDALDDDKTGSYQTLAIAIGTFIDKRRQEEGLAATMLDVKHRGHVTHGHVDLSKFSDDELADLERLAERYEGAKS